ncbi:MAG: excinuclease ABC subunit UvrC [candidate division KSB1 bacterium]|nr:excinuclease ABC subunit UvrC [candidate division KSB1 bacterium]
MQESPKNIIELKEKLVETVDFSIALSEKLENLPAKPGVYLFKDRNNRIIYIGKAKSLRNRVRSYFQNGRVEGAKLARLVANIHDLEFIVTDSEIEALILEANLVKEYKPRYNVNLKDDKSFPYIRVTNEPFPRIFPTRKIVRDGSRYFGPYTDVGSMKDLLKTVKRIFPIRSCNLNLTQKTIEAKKFKVCLDYHIKKCLGPCEGLISQEEYARIVQDVVNFINGRDRQVVRELKARMEAYAANQQYEMAAHIRDQIGFIEAFQYKQKVVTDDLMDRDILTAAVEDEDACGVVFKVRDGKVIGRQHFYLSGVEEENLSSIITSFLKQYYLKADFIPEEIYLPCPVEDSEFIEQWLQERRPGRVKLIVPKIGEKAKLVEMCNRNAKLLLMELKLQKMKAKDYIPHSVQALQRDLRLKHPPRRIEAFDISNIMGTDAVASMVTFVDGQPRKSDYRRFKIRTKSTPDDFAMMAEVIQRRYSRLQKENQEFPDLILVDGGKGQLSAALQVLNQLGIQEQPIVALAKRLDEVFVPGVSEAQNIPKTSSGLKLLQRIRDESHRFALDYHQRLRKKRTIQSALDLIPGIGKVRRKALIKHFGSVKRVKEASVEELSQVEGINPALAKTIWQFFHTEDKMPSCPTAKITNESES